MKSSIRKVPLFIINSSKGDSILFIYFIFLLSEYSFYFLFLAKSHFILLIFSFIPDVHVLLVENFVEKMHKPFFRKFLYLLVLATCSCLLLLGMVFSRKMGIWVLCVEALVILSNC